MKDYNPLEFEEKLYSWWEASGFFEAKDTSEAPPYCIVIPPPNVTGALHMGHALTNVIQDTIIRWRRMQGYNTLWLPGTDHAGIATQAVVERNLRREGTSRHELGRERFLEEVWKWKEQYGARITGQLRRLGSSLDWSRERFTMDEGLSGAVKEVFVRLYEQGLLYRDNRLINWCPSCRTALSNLEVEHEGHEGNFWHINYPVLDEAGNPTGRHVTVATTRPETMLGDTAVAVHPDPRKALQEKLHKAEKDLEGASDGERAEKQAAVEALRARMEDPILNQLEWLASLVGQKVLLPLTGRAIPVVGDFHADPALGTGAVKITPGHDFNDFEVGKRQSLERINILNEDGSLNENCGAYAGLTVAQARTRVVEDLTAQGYLDHVEPRDHEVGHCSRCDTVVEPMLSLQWFVDAKPLADRAIAAVRAKRTEIIPPMWEKVFYHWMENIEDWCVSRQLWWGHRIPAWYCTEGHTTVAREEPGRCSVCGSEAITRDEDVLDTWFSSALWPFSTLGWPEKTPALSTFYPNALMETGFDILFFWVARMMMMGLHFLDEVPFEKVFLHAMVRDNEGRKMSKSLGNTIDPLDVIHGISLEDLLAKVEAALPPESEKESRKKRILDGIRKKYPHGIEVHGADALRFTLAVMAAQGRDVKLDMARISGYRAFANKVWQAVTGMVLPHLSDARPASPHDWGDALEVTDRWILSRLSVTVGEVNAHMEEFRLNDAADAVYRFFWHEFCDWYLELAKQNLYGKGGEDAKDRTVAVLCHVTDTFFHLLHPFMPFISEKLWGELPRRQGDAEALMVSAFPKAENFPRFPEAEEEMELLRQTIAAVRTIRGENNVPPGAWVKLSIHATDRATRAILEAGRGYLLGHLTRADDLTFTDERPPRCAASPIRGGELFIPLEGLVNFDDEIVRLRKVLKKAEKDLEAIEKKLGNPAFLAKAPPEVIAENQARLEENRDRVGKLQNSLEHFEEMVR